MDNKNFDSEMEAFLDCLGQCILEDEQQPGIINPLCYQQLQLSYHILQKHVANTDMELSYELHKPFNSMGSIRIVGDDLVFENCRWLARAIGFASNLEVYPLVTGKLCMVLTFHGLVKRI